MIGHTRWVRVALTRAGQWGGVLLLVGASAAAAQSVRECSGGMPAFGSLGIGEYHCVGGTCAVNMRGGDPYAHSFSTEPRLERIDRSGPGGDVLQNGDVLVAIDGTLITTAEGGRKLGSIRPGQDVNLTLRRDGREIDARLQAESSCDLPRLTVTRGSAWDYAARPFGYTVGTTDSTYSALSTAWAVADSVYGSGVAFATPGSEWAVYGDSLTWARPLYTLADSAGLSYAIATSTLPGWGAAGVLSTGHGFSYGVFGAGRPPVEFGLELSCGDCGWRGSGQGSTFATAVFPVIESVEKNGPADRAGILPGDIMFSVEGSPITSGQGGRILGSLEAGESVTLEIRRGDRIIEVAITPREAGGRKQRM